MPSRKHRRSGVVNELFMKKIEQHLESENKTGINLFMNSEFLVAIKWRRRYYPSLSNGFA